MSACTFLRLAAVAACLGLAACAGTPPSALSAADDNRETAVLLEQYEQWATAPADEQRREFNAAQAAFERNPGDVSRLRLALLLSLPRVPWRDDGRIVALLSELPANGAPSLARNVARLLVRLAGERLRLQKDEQRRHDAALREEHQKVEELQRKLDALRTIDQEIRKQRGR